MEIVLFCTSRTTAREKAKEVQGKVKDFGSDAKAGERWAVLYEMPDDVQVQGLVWGDTLKNAMTPKSDAMKQIAEAQGLEVVDLPLAAAPEPEELKGVPVWVEDQTVAPELVELANKELLQTGLEQFMDSKIKDLDIPEGTKIVVARPTLKAPSKPKGKSNIRTGMMKSRKGALIDVTFKRSTLTAKIAAELHRLK